MLEKQANTVFLGIGSNLGNKKNNINMNMQINMKNEHEELR